MSPQSDPHGVNSIFQKLQKMYCDLAQKHPTSPSSFTTRTSSAGFSTSTRSIGEIGVLRNKIASLDETIHHQVLLVETLLGALKLSKELYISLKAERTQLISEVNLLSRQTRTNGIIPSPIHLCTEILIEICSYLSLNDFNSVFQVWGEMAYKAIPAEYTFKNLFDQPPDQLAKFSCLRIKDIIRDPRSAAHIVSVLKEQDSKGLWRELSIRGGVGVYQNYVFDVMRACEPYLAVVKHIELIRASGVRGNYACSDFRCLHEIRAPACTRLTLPITLLPCAHKLNSGNIRHLDVNTTHHRMPDSMPYFRKFNITNLRMLTIRTYGAFTHNAITVGALMAPNIHTFTVRDENEIESKIVPFLACFDCPNLDTLEYFGKHLIRPSWIPKCHHHSLKRISMHVRPGSPNSSNMPTLENVFEDLIPVSGDDDHVPFPCISHLAIPCRYPWTDFDGFHTILRQLLESRRTHSHHRTHH